MCNIIIFANIFPNEIIKIITTFCKAKEIIEKNILTINRKNNALNYILKFLIYNTIVIDLTQDFKTRLENFRKNYDKSVVVIDEEFIYNLNIIKNSIYSRKTYKNYLWKCMLNLLSSLLMNSYNNLLFKNNNNKKNIYYKNLKNAIKIWFELCVIHNIKFELCYSNNKLKLTNNNFIRINCRNLKPIKNFSKFYFAPKVCNNYNIAMDNYISKIYILPYLKK
jgi:hypothetical protein